MKRMIGAGQLVLLLLASTVVGQLKVEDLPTAKATTVLPADVPGVDGLDIDGPSKADVDEYVHLEVIGLPPIDSSQTLEEALKWTRNIAMRVQQPPESESVDFDVTLGFRLIPVLSWKLTLDLKASVAGDYAVAFAMPGEDGEAVRLATHGVRFGSGPDPPPPVPDPILQVLPGEPFSSGGPPGGPFEPPTMLYQIQNIGKGNLVWGSKLTVPWITASPSSGVLGPGQTVEVYVGFSESAKSLAVGIHAGAVIFQNTVNGKGDTPRLVALSIEGSPPPPPISEMWGVVIYESDDLDDYGPAMAQVLASTRLRDLDSRFHFRLFDRNVKNRNDQTAEEAKPWIEFVEDKSLPEPHLFLVYEGNNGQSELAYNAELPDNVDDAIALIRQYLPARGGR